MVFKRIQNTLIIGSKILLIMIATIYLLMACKEDTDKPVSEGDIMEEQSDSKLRTQEESNSSMKTTSASDIIDHRNINFDLLEELIHDEINRVKKENDLPELTNTEVLQNAAVDQNDYQVGRGILSHSQVNPKKENLRDRISYYGGGYQAMAENVLYEGFLVQTRGTTIEVITPTYAEQAKKMVMSWMNSPGHRQNILNSTYDKVGTSVAYNADLRAVFATQVFGRKF